MVNIVDGGTSVMRRLKSLAACGIAVACTAALLATLTGCSAQQSYTPPELTPTLASPTVAKDGVLRVGVNTDNAPLAGQPQSSAKIVGMDVDVAAALADGFGLKLEVVNVGTDAATALTNGDVDIVMGTDKADTTAAFWQSDAYLPTAVALFATPSNTTVPTDSAKPKIAAQVSSKSAWAVTNEFENGTITTTDDLKNAFTSLSSGEVDYVAADAIIGTYAAHRAGVDVHIVALMQQSGGYAVGVLDGNTELKQAISEALSTLTSNGTVALIEKKWLGSALDLTNVPLTEGAKASLSATPAAKPAAETPAAETPAAETPVEEASTTDTPVADTPVAANEDVTNEGTATNNTVTT